MYEIWLMLNIFWEIAAPLWPALLILGLLWAGAMSLALRARDARWRSALTHALGIGVIVAAVATLLMPGWTDSTFSDMGYWVDWTAVAGLGAAVGGVTAAFAWPVLAWQQGRAGT